MSQASPTNTVIEPDEQITPVDGTARLTPRKKAAVVVLLATVGVAGWYGYRVVHGLWTPSPATPADQSTQAPRSTGHIPQYTYARAPKAEATQSAQPDGAAPPAGRKKPVEVIEDIGKTRAPSGSAQPAQQPAPRPKNPRFEGSVVIGQAEGAALVPTAGAAAGAGSTEPASEAVAVTRPQRIARPDRTIERGTPATCTILGPLDTTFRSMPVCYLDRPVYSMAGGHRPLLNVGARLIGKSEPVKVAGQAAGFIEWTEVRDGALVATIASPAVDQMGRARIPGQTDTHFWQRFGPPAVLSILTGITANVGRGVAGGGVNVILPGVSTAGRTAAQTWVDQFSNIPSTFYSEHGIRVGIVFDRDVQLPEVAE